jgi:RNA polymerase sigma factor (sigma-70 family)
MANLHMERVVGQLRRIAQVSDGRPSDGQLLAEFIAQRAEDAFEGIVRRHGPMVLGVCRRVLKCNAEAEDAFQATFLVLVRKAGSIANRELLGHWLYRVAYHLALRARTASQRRHLAESQVRSMPAPDGSSAAHAADWQALLDQELNGLPEKYRAPLVLCDLQGRTRKEVAVRLGWPEGTLSSRLNRGRELLRQRLGRRGLVFAVGPLAVTLGAQTATAVPPLLSQATVRAAMLWATNHELAATVVSAHVAALTEGMVKAMFIGKWSLMASSFCAVVLLGAGVGAVLQHASADTLPTAVPAPAPAKQTIPQAAAATDAAAEARRWLGQLNSPKFREREEATQQLEKLGAAILPVLREAAAKPGELEFRRRVERVIAVIEASLWSALDKPRQAVNLRLGKVLAFMPDLDDRRLAEIMYLLTLARSPTEAEARTLTAELKQQDADRAAAVSRLVLPLAQHRDFNRDLGELNVAMLELQQQVQQQGLPALPVLSGPAQAGKLEAVGALLVKLQPTTRQQIDLLFLLTISRCPTDAERQRTEDHLKKALRRDQAFADWMWALVNSNEFILMR